jgi:hypothetical protein
MNLIWSILIVLGLGAIIMLPIWFVSNKENEGDLEPNWMSLAEKFSLTPNESLLRKKKSFFKGFKPELTGFIDGYLVVVKYSNELFSCKIELKNESNYSFDISKKNEIFMTPNVIKTGDLLFDNTFLVRDLALNLDPELLDETIVNSIIKRFSTNMLGSIVLKQKIERTEGLLDFNNKSVLEFSEIGFRIKNAQERKSFENRLVFLIEFGKRIDRFEA